MCQDGLLGLNGTLIEANMELWHLMARPGGGSVKNETRKLEYGQPPTPNPSEKDKQPKSFYILLDPPEKLPCGFAMGFGLGYIFWYQKKE